MNAESPYATAGAPPHSIAAPDSSLTPIRGSGGMRYRPLKQLGAGGMARVLLAFGAGPSGFTKLVVLKVLRKELMDVPGSREMFLTEARLSARLNHPNLVQVHEVIQSAEVPYLVMEHLDGKALSAIKIRPEFDSSMMLTVIAEALVGLHHAHELRDFDGTPLSIVHRDISPHNVFVTYDGVVKVLDFGIAKAATSSTHTETGEIKGKLTYMAPEQLLGDDIDRRADIFSIGCMLWEAAVGSRIWENVPAANLMHQLATGNIPRPSTRAEIDAELERIIVKATAAEPEQRYATALDLQRDLDAYLGQSGRRRSLREVGAALARIHREEREDQAQVIRHAMRESPVEVESTGSKAEVAYELSVNEKRPRRNWLFGAAAVGAACAAALLVAPQLRRSSDLTSARATAAGSGAAAQVLIQVRATPPQAIIAIDGQEQGSGMVTLNLPAGPRQRSIQISAVGFVSETRVMAFDRPQILDVTLEPLAEDKPQPAPVLSAPPTTEPASRASVTARTGVRRPPAAPPPNRTQCVPPYYFVNGIKTFKPECL